MWIDPMGEHDMQRISKYRISQITVAILSLSLLGFAEDDGYTKALESGKKDIPVVAQLVKLFHETRSFISYYNGKVAPPRWNSIVGLHGRYGLALQMGISLNESRTSVIDSNEPLIYLAEITKISKDPKTGATTVISNGFQKTITLKDWEKVVEAKGDFSVIGIKLVTDKPIEGFEKYWRNEH